MLILKAITVWLCSTVMLLFGSVRMADACTNVLVTAGASKDGSSMIAYNADSGGLMGMLYHYPSTTTEEEEKERESMKMKKIYEWDTGKYLGSIPEYRGKKYNVVGNTNEMGLVIAETTFGGVSILSPEHQPDAVIDYGSLIYLTLQRASTAEEAMDTMVGLMDEHGYASEGESFSIADRLTGQVWIMEVIGRGANLSKRRGAVYVARRVPDGYVSGHSNQARITTFPRDEPSNCRYSDDVVDLAKEMGLYSSSPDDPLDLNFSFSDVYDPLNFTGARFAEARTWSNFRLLSDDPSFSETYQSYALGTDLTNRMPLWIKPIRKLSLDDIVAVMSNHFDETALQSTSDLGAGLYSAPYRPRPLTWSHQNHQYFNERPVATQQTGWNFIAQIRMHLPPQLSSLLWFATDDSSTSPRFPVYGSSTAVSSAYAGKGAQDGVPTPLLEFDMSKAFWVQNMVSNFAYTRWNDVYPILKDRIATVQKKFQQEVHDLDQRVLALLQQDTRLLSTDEDSIQAAVAMATQYSVDAGDWLHKEWMGVYGELFARFRDFYTITPDPDDTLCQCKVEATEMTDAWKERIVEETKSRYEVPHSKIHDGDNMEMVKIDRVQGGTQGVMTKSTLRASKSVTNEKKEIDPGFQTDFTVDKTQLLAML